MQHPGHIQTSKGGIHRFRLRRTHCPTCRYRMKFHHIYCPYCDERIWSVWLMLLAVLSIVGVLFLISAMLFS